MDLVQVPDSAVWHAWGRYGIEHVRVSPTFYEDSGTPIDGDTGEDLEYLATYIDRDQLVNRRDND